MSILVGTIRSDTCLGKTAKLTRYLNGSIFRHKTDYCAKTKLLPIRNQIVRAESTFHNFWHFRHFRHFRHSYKEALRSIVYMATFMHAFVRGAFFK